MDREKIWKLNFLTSAETDGDRFKQSTCSQLKKVEILFRHYDSKSAISSKCEKKQKEPDMYNPFRISLPNIQ
jgi:hypothetical protein